jgi:ATP-dependent helicase HrpA
MSVANDAGQLALEIMQLYSAIKVDLQRLNASDPLAKDITAQLERLIYGGFIRHTPYQSLKALPRYLKAVQYRLDKRDNTAQKIQDVSRYATRYWNDVEKRAKKEEVIPEHDAFRWALEEFRVSLFAQHLKTAYPISVKRMDKAWDERG